MKVKRSFAGACAVLLIFLFGCTQLQAPADAQGHSDAAAEEAALALVTTHDVKKKSDIQLYDADLNLLQTKRIPYAGISVSDIAFEAQTLYFTPEGMQVAPTQEIVSYNLATGQLQEFDTERIYLMGLYVKDSVAYVDNTLNYETTITRVDTATGERRAFETEDFVCVGLYATESLLYAFTTDLPEGTNTLQLFDSHTLEWKASVDLQDKLCGASVVEQDGKLYFDALTQTEQGYLGCLDLEQNVVEWIPLSNAHPGEIHLFQTDKLLILYDQRNRSRDVALFDLKTREETVITLDYSLVQSGVSGNTLYGVELKTENPPAIHKYEYDGARFVHKKKIPLNFDEDMWYGGFQVLAP